MDPVILFGIIAFLIFSAIFYSYQEQKRLHLSQRWVAKHSGWIYMPRSIDLDSDLFCYYQFLEPLRQGSNQYALDVFEGRWQGYSSRAFTFCYETYSSGNEGMKRNRHYLSVVLIHVSEFFPRLSIHSLGLMGTVFGSVIFKVCPNKRLGFLSEEFTRKFFVDTRDEQFAQIFCTQDIMQFFLLLSRIHFEINQDVLVIYQPGRLNIEKLESYLNCLCRIYELGILRQSLF